MSKAILCLVIGFHSIFLLSGNSQQPPPLSDATWFFELNGTSVGPISPTVLAQLITTRTVSANTMVWNTIPNFGNWRSAGTIPELAGHFGGSPTPPPVVSPPIMPPTFMPPPLQPPVSPPVSAGGYIAKIGFDDHSSSSGEKHTSASEILKQDRANYHRFGKRDSEDQSDPYLTTTESRSSATFSMSSSVSAAILDAYPTVRVVPVNGVFHVSIISN